MFDTILIAYDGSDHAKAALSTAARLAKDYGSALHLTHTPQFPTPAIVMGAMVAALPLPPTKEEIEKAAEEIITEARAAAKAEGVALADVHLGANEPARVTLSVAETIKADLIVLGRRGLGSFGALALGSVSQLVSHGATCACLTVR